MDTIQIRYYISPVGELILGSYDGRLCLCDWKYRKKRHTIDTRLQKGLRAKYSEENSAVLSRASDQLDEFFAKKRTAFDLPYLFVGTDFQKKVWNTLLMIPYGKTISYAELSKMIENPTAVRAVAAANGANAIAIFVPCHRVIGSNGSLTGFAGGIHAKKRLLDIESSVSQLKLF